MGSHASIRALVSVAVLLAACRGDTDTAPGQSAPAGFRAEAEALCAPVAERVDRLFEAGSAGALHRAGEDLRNAELNLADRLRALDAPAGMGDELEAYTETLQRYAEAGPSPVDVIADRRGARESLVDVVDDARLGIRLEEAAAAAGLPPECPPGAGVDVDNGLFVAKANLRCFDLRKDVTAAGPIEPPRTAEEVALVLDLARRLSAGIARAVERSAPEGVLEMPVKEIIRANKKRFLALGELGQTFRDADFGAYKRVSRKLVRISRKADRKMLSLALVQCAKAFGPIPL